ncbi:hypothetical protein [Citrobacter freundii]|uniref:hypothetical protein n=1 Tax=Citrobacter freundii TaxID=546 RepID=UPI001FFE19AD|nr:hypothetical protein [Citrobacter freundii]
MAAPLGRLALIPLLLITACHQPVSSTQAGPVPFAVNQQQVVDNTTLEISRSALEYNIHKVQQLLADKTRMCAILKEGANKRGNSSRLTQSFHFFMFEPIFSPVNALNQPI